MTTGPFMIRLSLLALALGGCDIGINGGLIGAGDGDGGTGGADLSAAATQTGLPCDVARILTDSCLSCHGTTLAPGVPAGLVSYEQLAAESLRGGSYAIRSLARMKDSVAPMPPKPATAVSPADIALFEAWVNAGIPKGSCEGSPPDLGGADLAVPVVDLAGAQPPAQTGLPCDVASVMAVCLGCHGNPPSQGAPSTFVTRADLVAMSGGQTGAARSLARMKDAMAPMPPAPNAPLSPAQIATFEAWINGGMKEGTCDMMFDGGVVVDPYNTPDVCTSKITWAGGEQDWGQYPKAAMHPGMPCVDCHDNPKKYNVLDTGPGLLLAGTVYPTAHEFDNCFGVNGTKSVIEVEVTDKNKRVVKAVAGVSGDFYIRTGLGVTPLAYPITALVRANGKVRAMVQSVSTGDCNSCHTLRGTMNAPGRIMAP